MAGTDSITPTWSVALKQWRAWLIASGRPATTLRLRTWQLRRFAEAHPDPWTPTTLDIVDWLGAQGWATETLRSNRAALRGFYRWAVIAGHLDSSPADALPSIAPAHHIPRPAPEAAVHQGLESLDPRVRVMVHLAASCGLRRGEIAQVHADDLTEGLGGWTLLVHGKGARDRQVPLSFSMAAELRSRCRRGGGGWCFPGRTDGHLSPDYVGKLIAGALPGAWTAHPLRHRFATLAYAGSGDLLAVQTLLGHSRPETTQQYVQLPDDALRRAAQWAA